MSPPHPAQNSTHPHENLAIGLSVGALLIPVTLGQVLLLSQELGYPIKSGTFMGYAGQTNAWAMLALYPLLCVACVYVNRSARVKYLTGTVMAGLIIWAGLVLGGTLKSLLFLGSWLFLFFLIPNFILRCVDMKRIVLRPQLAAGVTDLYRIATFFGNVYGCILLICASDDSFPLTIQIFKNHFKIASGFILLGPIDGNLGRIF